MIYKIKTKTKEIVCKGNFNKLKRLAGREGGWEGNFTFTTNTGKTGTINVVRGKDYSTKSKQRKADGRRKRTGGGYCAAKKTMFNTKLSIVWDSSRS